MKGTRNKSVETRLAKIGVTIRYPAPKKRPHEYVLHHAECGKTWIVRYLELSREQRANYWRCPNGCHETAVLK